MELFGVRPIFVLIYVDLRKKFRNFNFSGLENDGVILICVHIAQNHLKNVKFLGDNERLDIKNQKLHLETPRCKRNVDFGSY